MWNKTAPTEEGYYWYRDISETFIVKVWQSVVTKVWYIEYFGNEDGDRLIDCINCEFWSERIEPPVETVATFDVTKYCAERDTAMRVATSQRKIMMEGVE